MKTVALMNDEEIKLTSGSLSKLSVDIILDDQVLT